MKLPTLRDVATEAKLLLIGIPVLHLDACCRSTTCSCSRSRRRKTRSPASCGPTIRRCTISTIVFNQQHYFLQHFWLQFWNSLVIAVAVGALTLFDRDRRRVRDQPAEGAAAAAR